MLKCFISGRLFGSNPIFGIRIRIQGPQKLNCFYISSGNKKILILSRIRFSMKLIRIRTLQSTEDNDIGTNIIEKLVNTGISVIILAVWSQCFSILLWKTLLRVEGACACIIMLERGRVCVRCVCWVSSCVPAIVFILCGKRPEHK